MLKFLIEAFKASKGRMPNNLEMLLLRQKATNQAIDERKVVNIFDREPVNPNKPIMGGKNIPETEDDIRRRLMKQNEEGIASIKKKLEDPEKKAMGGRIGYKVGSKGKAVEGLIKLLKNKFGKKAVTTADKAPIPPKTLERDMFKKADKRLNDKRMLDDDEYQDFLDEVGGADQLEAYDFDGTAGSAKRILKEQKQYMDDMELEYKKGNLDPVAGDKSPARKKFLQNKLDEMEMSGDKKLMTVDEIEELSSFDLGSEMDVAKSLAPKMVERLQLKQKYPGITDDLLDKILIDDNMQRKAEVLATIDEAFKMMEKGKGADEIIDTIKNVTRTKQADGGITRIGLKSGSYLFKGGKKLYKSMIPESRSMKLLLGATEGESGIAELLRLLSGSGMFADGGRAGFMAGGMGRRGFLKLLGMTGAGIAGAKTGLMSLAKKSEPVVEAVKETAQEVPSYFFSLVNKIRSLGDDTLATQDKTIAKKYKDYTMEEDFAGNIEIIKKGDDVAEDVFMSYKVDEVPLKKGGSRKVEEYEEYTARPDMEGKMKDIEPGVPDNVVEEAMGQAPSIKKADGGIMRAGYQTGGDVAFDASDKNIYGSSAMTIAPDTVMDAFGNQVQSEMGNDFNKPLIPQVTEEVVNKPPMIGDKNTVDSKFIGLPNSNVFKDIPVAGGIGGLPEIDMPVAGGNNNAGGILPVMPPSGGMDFTNASLPEDLRRIPDEQKLEQTPNMSDEDIMKGFAEYQKQNPYSGPSTQAVVNLTLPGGTPMSFRSGAGAAALRQYLKSIGMEAGPGQGMGEPLKKTVQPGGTLAALASGGIARMLGE